MLLGESQHLASELGCDQVRVRDRIRKAYHWIWNIGNFEDASNFGQGFHIIS